VISTAEECTKRTKVAAPLGTIESHAKGQSLTEHGVASRWKRGGLYSDRRIEVICGSLATISRPLPRLISVQRGPTPTTIILICYIAIAVLINMCCITLSLFVQGNFGPGELGAPCHPPGETVAINPYPVAMGSS